MMNHFNPFQVPSEPQRHGDFGINDKRASVRQHTAIAVVCVLSVAAGLVLSSTGRTNIAGHTAPATVNNQAMASPRNANVIGAMAIERGRVLSSAASVTRSPSGTGADGLIVLTSTGRIEAPQSPQRNAQKGASNEQSATAD